MEGKVSKETLSLCMVFYFFSGSKNIHYALYSMKNVGTIEEISTLDLCEHTIDVLCESVKKRASTMKVLLYS